VLTASPLSYTDPDSGDFSNRFYRVRPAP
jgi:hypothetical protein